MRAHSQELFFSTCFGPRHAFPRAYFRRSAASEQGLGSNPFISLMDGRLVITGDLVCDFGGRVSGSQIRFLVEGCYMYVREGPEGKGGPRFICLFP